MKRILLFLLILGRVQGAYAQRVEINKPVVLTGNNPADRQLTGLGTPTDSTNAVSARVVQAGRLNYGAATGTANGFRLMLQPAPPSYTAGMVVYFKASTGVTGACTLNLNNLGSRNIYKNLGMALTEGDISAGEIVCVIYDGTSFRLFNSNVLKNTIDNANIVPYKQLSNQVSFSSSGTWVVPGEVTKIIVEVWGAGGGGGELACGSPCGINSTNVGASGGLSAGGSGGSGGYARSILSVTPGSSYNIVVGTGGCMGACGNAGVPGGSSEFGALVSAMGGRGGSQGQATNSACTSPVSGGAGGAGGGGMGQFILTGVTGQTGGSAVLTGGNQTQQIWVNGRSGYLTNEFVGFTAAPTNPAYIDAYFYQARLKASAGGMGNSTNTVTITPCGDKGFVLVSY